jgi:hypothetical protein
MDPARRATYGLALLVFLISATVYLITLTPTVPFWDAGEFIAVSTILGIPHPPGTPLYVLLGRIATLVPWRSIAERVNALSAIPGALAIVLTYLTTLKFIRLAMSGASASTAPAAGAKTVPGGAAKAADSGDSDGWATRPGFGWQEWVAHIGAFCGALMLAFSDSFWENSIEAEVYALMSFAQVLVLWLGLRWWEEHERRPTSGPLLLAVYVMWLSVGLHLGVGIMGVPLLLLVWLVDRKAAVVFLMPLLTVLLVTVGLERMAGGVLLLSGVVYLVYAHQKKLPAIVAYGSVATMLYPLSAAFGDRAIDAPTAFVGLAALLVPLVLLAKKAREGRIMALALFLMVAGYSTHLYLPIRAAQHPAVNEGAPDSWDKLRDLLERKQYGEMNMFQRRAPLSAQLNKEFWRYFSRQWPLFPTERLWGVMLPLALGIAGAVWLARRNRRSFLYSGAFFGLTTAGMIVFLNFTDHEVRDRDYFFQSGYHAYAIWIGLGAAWLIMWVRDSFKPGMMQRVAWQFTALLMIVMPFLLMKNLWFTHDRRGNSVAQDYAYNMLAPLAPNSFVFTNGDNDTFPLWYIQQVENVRKDVRVVNLSLLNTDWYIRQLRDEYPKVPIALDDETVSMLGAGAIRDSSGNIIYTSHFMVDHIMRQNRNPDGTWKSQPYFAVTVPEHMGLDKNFTLEGLVYRVNPDTNAVQVDEPVTRKALYDVFRYKGLFEKDGSWDQSVYKDENASTLSRNYAAAHLQLAFYYRRKGEIAKGIAEMERVQRMFPDYTDLMVPLGSFYMDNGDTVKALALFKKITDRNPGDAEARYYYGVVLSYRGDIPGALQQLDQVIRIDPSYSMAYYAAYFTLWESGQRERALTYVERWVQANPGDAQAQQLLVRQRRELGLGVPPATMRPPLPQLP